MLAAASAAVLPFEEISCDRILADYRLVGERLWSRFKGRKRGTLRYYRKIVEALRAAGSGPLVAELDRVVSEIERLAGGQHPH